MTKETRKKKQRKENRKDNAPTLNAQRPFPLQNLILLLISHLLILLSPGQWQVAKLHRHDRGDFLGPLTSSRTQVIHDLLQSLQRQGLVPQEERGQLEPRGSRQIDLAGRWRHPKTERRHRGRNRWCHEGRKSLLVCHSGRDQGGGGGGGCGEGASAVGKDLAAELVLAGGQGLMAFEFVSGMITLGLDTVEVGGKNGTNGGQVNRSHKRREEGRR